MIKILSLFLGALLVAAPGLRAEDSTDLFENLVPLEGAKVGMAYIDPNADFTVFQRVKILEPFVAFRADWQRDQNRSSRRIRVTASDMDRIKADVAALFKEVFTERLEADDGYEVVEETGDDVLILRPAIIDLDITAPDTRDPGRNRTFSASTGSATVYIELYDSLSGAILGRAADRRGIRSSGNTLTWSNGVRNRTEARRMMATWADKLREFLDSHYKGE